MEKRPETHINKSDDIGKILLENIHDGAFFTDTEGNILTWNKGAETITGYPETAVKGRACKDVLKHIDEEGNLLCEIGCPIRKAIREGAIKNFDAFVLHREGYRLPVSLKVIPFLGQTSEVAGTIQIFNETSPRLVLPPGIQDLGIRELLDTLTETGNRQFLQIYLKNRFEELQKFQIPFSLLYIDIDHFSKLKETYGGEQADKTLHIVAKTLLNNVRMTDIVGRWEEDRFVAIILNVDETKLRLVADKLRLLVQKSYLPLEDRLIQVTVSIGATAAHKRETPHELLERAKKLMLQSKQQGRNRVSSRLNRE